MIDADSLNEDDGHWNQVRPTTEVDAGQKVRPSPKYGP